MAAVWMRLRADLRRTRRSAISTGVLIALVGAVVLAAAAGARRTQTAYDRLLVATQASRAIVQIAVPAGREAAFEDSVRRLPYVSDAGSTAGFIVGWGSNFEAFALTNASKDGGAFARFARPKMLAGRLPRLDRDDEVLAGRLTADRYGVKVGSLLDACVAQDDGSCPERNRLSLRVVGIGVFPNEVEPTTDIDQVPALFATPAFARRFVAVEQSFGGLQIVADRRVPFGRLQRDLRALAIRQGSRPEDVASFLSQDFVERDAKVRTAIRPQPFALWAFAAIIAVAGLVTVGQTLRRQAVSAEADQPALRAMGMSRAQLVAPALVRTLILGVPAALIAVALAFGASRWMPIGSARLAEPAPGFEANVALLGWGALAILILPLAWIATSGWFSSSRASGATASDDRRRPSSVAGAMSRVFPSPAAGIGVRMALEPGGGRTSVPVRSAIAGTTAAIAVLVGAFTFGANLTHLVSTPRAYGWNWDVLFDVETATMPVDGIARAADDPSIAGVTGGLYTQFSVAGKQVTGFVLDRLDGDVYPTLIEGRPATARDEIVLGSTTLQRVGARIGDRVDVGMDGERRRMLVVGVAVFPALTFGSIEPPGLGEGAAVAWAAKGGAVPGYNFVLVRLEPDDAAAETRLASALAREAGCEPAIGCVPVRDDKPGEIANAARVRATPLILSALLGFLAVGTLGHVLATSVRTRRRDLAILKTLGLVGRHVRRVVAWQASTLAIAALAVGVPLGIAAGRWLWIVLAGELGVLPQARVPLTAFLVIPGTIVVANALAAFPARAAARTQAAVVLRSE